MTNNDNQRNPLLVASLLLVAAALSALNWPQLVLGPLPVWYRLGGETLLVAGLIGSIMRSRSLRLAGWIGIGLFGLYMLIGSIPVLNQPVVAATGDQQAAIWLWRVIFSLVLCVALVLCFKRLAPKSAEPPGPVQPRLSDGGQQPRKLSFDDVVKAIAKLADRL